MKVAVTGSSARLARTLLPLLADDRRIDQIIGIDWRDAVFDDPRFTQVLLDLRSAQVRRVLTEADAVVHLVLTEDTGAADREQRVAGSHNIFRCAAAQCLSTLIHVSSAAVYSLPARERPIKEEHPRAALPGIALVAEQVEFEQWLDDFQADCPDPRVVRLRPHLPVGTDASAHLRWLRAPFHLKLRRAPRLQCVRESDVARAIQAALFKNVDGAYNLACADSATLRTMHRLRGGGLMPLPFALAHAGLKLARRNAAWLEMLRHEIVLDTSRARRRLGWKPEYDSIEACLTATAPEPEPDGRDR